MKRTARGDTAPTRAERNAHSGRRLLEALVDLVAKQGYDATTAAEIGVHAGFSRAMVHARYGTKDALLDELMCAEYESRILAGDGDAGTGLQRVQAHIDRVGQLATTDERFLKAMFVLSFEAVRGSSGVKPRITRWLADLEAGLVDAFAAGTADGSVRADIVPTTAARESMIDGFGIAYAWIVMPGTDLYAELARWRARIARDYSPREHVG